VYAATSQMEKNVIADHDVTQFQLRSVHITCIAKSLHRRLKDRA